MEAGYRISFVEKPEQSAWGIIGRGLDDYNKRQAGEDRAQRLCFALHAPDSEIVGGIVGVVFWDWLSIELLWVRDDLHGHGYGHQLLESIENEARRLGASRSHLDTFSFQAPKFYLQHGYRVFGQLDNFPPGHQRLYLMKDL